MRRETATAPGKDRPARTKRGPIFPHIVRSVGNLYERWANVILKSEARWTMPTPRVPHLEWWHRGVWEGTEVEVRYLLAALVTALQPELVLETGTAYGQTAEILGMALLKNGHGRLITLEKDSERCQISQRRCRGLPVEVINTDTMQYMPPATVNLAFFDSLPRIRALEFRRFRPAMTTSTVVAFHDSEAVPILRSAVETLAKDGLVRPVFLPTPKGLALCEILPLPGRGTLQSEPSD